MDDLHHIYRIISSQLGTWRYFLLMSLFPLVIAVMCKSADIRIFLGIALMFLYYYCWRVYMDEKIFALLADGIDISAVDRVNALLWKRDISDKRDLESRMKGTGRLIRRAGCGLLTTWLLSLISVYLGNC